MLDLKERDSDTEPSEDDEFDENGNRIKKKKKSDGRTDKSQEARSEEDGSGAEDDQDRPAAFFRKKSGYENKEEEEEPGQSIAEQVLDVDLESGEADAGPEGLTEAEIKEAAQAIIDGLTRELKREYEESVESSVAELEAVAVASFVDSVRDKIDEDTQDLTDELLDEALTETLEDLLVIDDGPEVVQQPTPPQSQPEQDVASAPQPAPQRAAHAQSPSPIAQMGGPGGSGPHGGGGGSSHGSAGSASAPVVALLNANKGLGDQLVGVKNKRGMGLLVGGVVGYIVGSRHGRKKAEEKLQPEIDKLENQVTELYDALAAREHMIRHVVRELAARQLGPDQADKLAAMNAETAQQATLVDRRTSKDIDSPSIVLPAAFAALLVSKRLKVDTSQESHTWGKDFIVGGVAGYMIGRRRGRQQAEAHIKTGMEQLETRVAGLKNDLVTKDAMIHAMVRVSAEAHDTPVAGNESLGKQRAQEAGTAALSPSVIESEAKKHVQAQEKQLVDASIDRVALARKKREIGKHKKHLKESGAASAVGQFNLASSVFMERRLMDGTENSSSRKPIETMDEHELLAMSQDMYVDGESAIELYDKGRVEIEVLRKSVIEFWRKTGDYEQTLRKNLTPDESAVNDIRANLEQAYRSILEKTEVK